MGKHRKWQDIMVLEVQDGGEAIPLGRLDAFVRGESLREGVETQFLRKRHIEHNSALHNTHTTKMYSWYWCSYGPEDNRKKSPNKKRAWTYKKKEVVHATSLLRCYMPQGANRPFIMGIQMAWMLDMMVRFSHDSIISMDSTFATNKYGYQLYSCLVFEEQQSGVPIAWVVTSRNKIEDIQVWLMELQRREKEKRPGWRINAFITDDASAEIQAIETVLECRVILCIWHMHREWLKNVYKNATKER
ncbi:hypothetical protein SUGI_1091990 [Cryptomeria japonica]|nr:hypothetical protein SUGI_1091990 [Cryptomeria japonica]